MYLVDRPDDESLPRAYESYYTHQPDHDQLASGRGGSVVARLINGYLNARYKMSRADALRIGNVLFSVIPPLRMKLDVYGRHVPAALCKAGTRLLDVGCGNGAFLQRAQEMGIHVFGCEPDASAAATCRSNGLEVVTGEVWAAGYPDKSFDYITLNHVIEHVVDAPRLLEKLHDLLKPSGVLWLALPNPHALGARLFGRGWKGLHPPFHLLIPSQRILHSWLTQSRFADIHFVRRGLQSPGLWRDSVSIARRERVAPSTVWSACVRRLGDLLSSVSPRWGEETIVMAHRTGSGCEN